jgi:sulfate transport system permease protein
MRDGAAARGVAVAEPAWARRVLIGVALAFLAVFLLSPLVAVFVFALQDGVARVVRAIGRPDTLAAIRLTLVVAALSLPTTLVFGLAASWLIARFRFPGKGLLLAIIDLPISISPVVAGLAFVLLLGRGGPFGPLLDALGVRFVFAVPGIVVATTFVTLPLVAHELIPLLQAQGSDAEEAAYTLGAGPWRTFFRVTLPKMKWALVYGVVLAKARAMGEFGAVSVIGGHVRGLTNTMPLQAEILYDEYDLAGAFAVAALLSLLAVASLLAKKLVEVRT